MWNKMLWRGWFGRDEMGWCGWTRNKEENCYKQWHKKGNYIRLITSVRPCCHSYPFISCHISLFCYLLSDLITSACELWEKRFKLTLLMDGRSGTLDLTCDWHFICDIIQLYLNRVCSTQGRASLNTSLSLLFQHRDSAMKTQLQHWPKYFHTHIVFILLYVELLAVCS